MGQLPLFIQYLKMVHLFEPWIDECPLHYVSNNSPKKVNILGSLLISILSGHTRYYAHMTSLMSDNAKLLGMSKVVSDDCARRALQRLDVAAGVCWLQLHLHYCYSPLLSQPWILNVEVKAGNQSASSYSAPGLWSLLYLIPQEHRPVFIRGDCDWGNDGNRFYAESSWQVGVQLLFLGLTKPVYRDALQTYQVTFWYRIH